MWRLQQLSLKAGRWCKEDEVIHTCWLPSAAIYACLSNYLRCPWLPLLRWNDMVVCMCLAILRPFMSVKAITAQTEAFHEFLFSFCLNWTKLLEQCCIACIFVCFYLLLIICWDKASVAFHKPNLDLHSLKTYCYLGRLFACLVAEAA